jgi:predicted enzyme related to lactoylglutathione lyase
MPRVQGKPAGAPVWIELTSTDPEEAGRFYSAALGLEPSEPKAEFGGYRDLLHGQEVIAGLLRAQGGAPSAWRVYLLAPELDQVLGRVQASGGEIVLAPEDVQGLGRRAILRDPSGAELGLWELDGFEGTPIEDEPGTPCWYELHTTREYPKTVEFYQDALGWELRVLSDSDQFRMVTYREGPEAEAGIVDASSGSPEEPSRWNVYFAVTDADEAADRVRQAGGTVLDGPMDTPFGRISHATDSTGAAFTVIQLPEEPRPVVAHRGAMDSEQAEIAATIRALLAARAATSTICPSDVARTMAPESWRHLMEPVRRTAARMMAEGEVEVTQRGSVVDPATARGPLRIRWRRTPEDRNGTADGTR